MTTPRYTVPGMKPDAASEVIGLLQDRLNALNDLALTYAFTADRHFATCGYVLVV